jgi:hypothetical protein
MDTDRRKFLQQMASVCAGGVARTLGVGCTAAVTTNAAAAATVAAVAAPVAGAYGSSVRNQVFEVIVRQAMAGAPWQTICKAPMQVNNITEAEVEAEVQRRAKIVHSDVGFCQCQNCFIARAKKHREELLALDSIPHSEKAPCACKDCREAIRTITEEHRKKVKTLNI